MKSSIPAQLHDNIMYEATNDDDDDCRSTTAKGEKQAEGTDPSTTGSLPEVVSTDSDDCSFDDFTSKELKIEGKDLSWHGLSVSYKVKNTKKEQEGNHPTEKAIISNVSGSALPSQLTCILGHSGSGKSTLLNVLAGRKFYYDKDFTVAGDVRINNGTVSTERLSSRRGYRLAYVCQNDVDLGSATPREAMRFSARMRLPRHVIDEEIEKATNETIKELKLAKIADRIATAKHGFSGGERRRITLGLELVTRPCILLLDEVTSGLDSHNAFLVIQILQEIARRRHTTVLITMHQPDSRIFSAMDRIILMNSGECMYEGMPDEMEECFEGRGFAVPHGYGLPEWALEVSQTETTEHLKNCGFFDKQEEAPSAAVSAAVSLSKPSMAARISFGSELMELLCREAVRMCRDLESHLQWFGTIGGLSALIAICFWGVAVDSIDNSESFASHVGVIFLLSFACVITFILGVQDGALERPSFCREYSTGHYGIFSYAITKTVSEFLINLGCGLLYQLIVYWSIGLQGRFWYWLAVSVLYGLVSSALGSLWAAVPDDPTTAIQLVPLAVLPQMLLAGFLVTYESLPVWIRWLNWLQPLTYSFRLLLHEDFKQCTSFSHYDELVLNCANALQGARNVVERDGLGGLYSEESKVTLMQAGQYLGPQSILEYFTFFSGDQNPSSMLWDSCKVSGTQVVHINGVEEGICDITLASTHQTQVNQFFTKKSFEEDNAQHGSTDDMYHLIFGRHIKFGYSTDLTKIAVVTDDLFLPPSFMETVYNTKVDQTSMATMTCAIQESRCPEVFAQNGYRDSLDCVEALESLPLTTTNANGLMTVDGNSTGCRQLHSNMAAIRPEVHCPHLSLTPMEDIDGNTKCSASADYSQEDYFSKEDMLLFQRAAQLGDIDTETFFKELTASDDTSNCIADENVVVETSAMQAANALPENYHCFRYLETQNATGDLTFAYWMALILMWIFFRGLAFFFFHRKAFLH